MMGVLQGTVAWKTSVGLKPAVHQRLTLVLCFPMRVFLGTRTTQAQGVGVPGGARAYLAQANVLAYRGSCWRLRRSAYQ